MLVKTHGSSTAGYRTEGLQSFRRVLLALLFSLVALLPFVATAFRIDEPNIIAIAEQIAREPLDPYGFVINWNGIPEPAFEILANPPLLPAWLAAWAAIFGWGEISLHTAVLPFAAAALLAFGLLARKAGYQADLALVLLLASPAFYLSAQVVMPDVAMLSAFLLSVAAGFPRVRRSGAEVTDAKWFQVLAVVSGMAAPLLKYNAILLVPIHFAMFLLFPERRRVNAALTLMPLMGLALWSGVSAAMYGDVHFLAISRFQQGGNTLVTSGLIGALGLAVLPLAAAIPLARMARASGIAVAVVTGFACAGIAGWLAGYTPDSTLLYGISGAGVTLVLIGAVRESEPGSDTREWRIRVLLLWWLFAVLVFQFRLLFVSVRYLLPLLPPLLLLVMRYMNGGLRRQYLAIGLSLLMTGAIAWGDARIANTYRTFFEKLNAAGLKPQTADGHWGFQYYAERLGAEVIDPRHPLILNEGEVHVNARVPFSTMKRPEPGPGIQIVTTRWYAHPRWPVRTIDCESAANFHGNVMKNCRHYLTTFLPFGFSSDYSDVFEIYRGHQNVREER